MAVSDEFILEVKARNDIESVVGGYVNLKRAGSLLKGLCPFHGEKTPSFTVYPGNGSFYCFGCGAGGDVITFIRKIENLDYMEALKLLADRAGLAMPEDGGYDDSMRKLRLNLLSINRETARFFHAVLLSEEGRPALDYLLGRGLTMTIIRHFGLGFAPDSWDRLLRHLRQKGYSEEELILANVCGRGRNGGLYDRFRKRVMFPIIDLRGSVVAFSGRAMPGEDKAGQKYVNTSDTPVFKKSHHIFAMNFAKNACADRLILVEGQMDAISLHQAGITNAVAVQGTAFTTEQARLIAKYTKEVVIAMDADGAGKKATDKILRLVGETGLPVKVVRIPDGKDPDEFVKKNGGEAFRDLLSGASGDIEYRLLSARDGFDLSTNDGVRRYLNKAAEILAEGNDIIARDLYAGRLSASFGVSKEILLDAIKKQAAQNAKSKRSKALREAVALPADTPGSRQRRMHLRAAGAEETLLSLLMYNPDFLKDVEKRLSPEDFTSDLNRRIYSRVIDILRQGGSFDISLMGAAFSPDEMGTIAMMQSRGAGRVNARAELSDCLRVMEEEKARQTLQGADKLSPEEWEKSLEEIRKMKKGDTHHG